MEVSEDFELVGQPFALVVATLGLPSDTLVKVRRRHSPEDAGVGKRVQQLDMDASNGAFFSNGGSGGGGGGSNETCALDSGDEESNGSSWAGRHDGGKVGSSLARLGGSGSPFALRRRTYQLLENQDGEERPVRNAGFKGPGIEMTTTALRPQKVAKAAWEGDLPTKTNGGAQYQYAGNVDGVHDVSPDACVHAGDVLVLSAARDAMVYAQGSVFSGRREGLKVLGVSTVKLPQPQPGSVFFELVLSRSSQFLGRTARADNEFFAARYGCSVVAFRLKGVTTGTTGGSVGVIDSSNSNSIRRSNGGADAGGTVETTSSGGGLLSTIAACGSPQAAAVGTAADNLGGELFFMGGDDSPVVDGGEKPLDATAPTPLLSSFVGDDSPTAVPVSPRPAEPGLESNRRRRRRRRRGEAFEAGDVVMVLATERFSERHPSAEFLRVKLVGRLPEATGWFHCFPLAVFALMLMWVLLGGVEMVRRRTPSRVVRAVLAASCVCVAACFVCV